MRSESAPLIDIQNLHVAFPTDDGIVNAVQDVSFAIPRGGTVGLVGESGCGKSMTGLALLQLISKPGKVAGGHIQYYGAASATPVHDIAILDPRGDDIRSIRGRHVAMIFQEPMSSLNPVYTVGQQISEMILAHEKVDKREARNRSVEMLKKVGIPAPEQRIDEFPHQLSGGMRQRAIIAIALACNPALLIADEPTTALDVTVQAQILDLMRQLQDEMGMAILMISHDLGVIADLAEQVVVMYAGRVVEKGTAEQVFYSPQHPYTQGLLRSAPVMGTKSAARLYSIPGTVPNPLQMPRGCSFRPRCPERFAKCLEMPALLPVENAQLARCWARQKEIIHVNA